MSDEPGLWVRDATDKTCKLQPAQGLGPILSVLVGETLQYLTNKRYPAYLHGVEAGVNVRHAVVFQLRADLKASVDLETLIIERTGHYQAPLRETIADFEERRFAGAPTLSENEPKYTPAKTCKKRSIKSWAPHRCKSQKNLSTARMGQPRTSRRVGLEENSTIPRAEVE